MNKKTMFLFCTALLILAMASPIYAASGYSPIIIADTPPGIHVEIRPEVELLAGVLSQTSWMKQRGPHGAGNEYFRELKSFFAAYQNHKAIKLAEELTKKGFSYDAPPCFILSLGPLPNLEPINGYSDYLLKRAGGSEKLENFRQELVKLAVASNFIDFYQKHRSDLEETLHSGTKNFNGTKVLTWLQKFFSSKGDEYYLVFAPAFFPGGGYAATIDTKDGWKIVYEVVREKGESVNNPEFNGGKELEALTLHEWGHSFVNPALDKHKEKVGGLIDLFYPVKKIMTQMAYGEIHTFFNEQVLRAAVLLAIEEFSNAAEYQMRLEYEQQEGFYLTKFTVEQLRYYQKNRDQYPTFADFIPFLLGSYEKQKNDLLLSSQVGADELKEMEILKAYWNGDPQIRDLKARLPHSLLIKITGPTKDPLPKQIGAFINKAGQEFELRSEGCPPVPAKLYEGNIYTADNRTFWGLWLAVDDQIFPTVKPGAAYRLIPLKQNPDYRWVIDKELSLTLPKP